jgi:hypothetical protein
MNGKTPSTPSSAVRGLVLDVRNPPADLPYSEIEDFRQREILKANGIGLAEHELVLALEHPTNILQAAAAHTLGAVGSRAANRQLLQLMSSPDDLVKVEAAYALARIGVEAGIDGLRDCLSLPLEGYIAAPLAAGFLARLNDERGFQTIVRGLDSRFPEIRMIACKQIYFFIRWHGERDPNGQRIDVYQQFGKALQDSNEDIAWQALVQIRQISAAELRSLLVDFVAKPHDAQLLGVARDILQQIDSETMRNRGPDQ